MNKKLLALAIAGAFIAPAAMADSSNVTIYGEFAGSVDNVDGGSYKAAGGNANSAESRARVSSNNSFLGFKGKEDLGNGLSAIWQYEQSIAIDKQNINNNAGDTNPDLTSNQSRRNTFVGLSSKQLGAVTLGIQDTPTKKSTGPLDPFGQHTLADYRSLMGAVGGSVRAQNSVMYSTPNLSGFTGKVLWAATNEAGNDTSAASMNNPSFWSASAAYRNGPIYGVLAYERSKGQTAAGILKFKENGANQSTLNTTRVGFGYNFGVAKLGVGYERTKLDNITSFGNLTNVDVTASNTSRNAWYVSGTYNITGNNVLKAAYTHAGSFSNTSSTGAKQMSVGLSHNFSKRTEMFALYTKVSNDSNINYALGGGATGIAQVSAAGNGESPRGFSLGMIHKF
ncbi:MAG: porin [Burkholderiales bacterium]